MGCTFKIATTRDEVLRAMVVRSIVFIGEQRCPFREEFDGLDAGAIHVLGEDAGEPVAAARIRNVDGWAKLERIAVLQQARGQGLGHRLVEYMLEVARERGFRRFKMHAQAYLVDFYRKHGFEPRGEIFQEAGIDHYLMVREPGSAAEPVDSAAPRWAAPEAAWPASPAPLPEPAPLPDRRYVGFWARFWAALLDSLLFIFLVKPILVAHYGWEYLEAEGLEGQLDFVLSYMLPVAATLLFWHFVGATPGKMVVHARVVDARTGGRPSLGRLVGRYLGYFLSALPLFLGFLWVAFDPQKQGWHDKLAGTVVMRKNSHGHSESKHTVSSETPRDDDWLPF